MDALPSMLADDDQLGNVRPQLAHRLIALVPGEMWTGTDADDTRDGTGNDDSLEGAGGNDRLTGDAGNDLLSGGTGNDSLFGGSGSDTLTGGLGNDLLERGSGFDFISYAAATSAVTVSLRSPMLLKLKSVMRTPFRPYSRLTYEIKFYIIR